MSAHVRVESYRSRIQPIGGGIEVVMPSRRHLFTTCVFGLWFAFWIYSAVAVLPQMRFGLNPAHATPPPPWLFIAWTIGWAAGGLLVLAVFLWSIVGTERVTIDSGTFAIRREVFGVGLVRRYAIASVRALRVVDVLPSSSAPFGFGGRDPFGLRSGPLVFDYGAKTLRFGSGVDPAEAKHILSRVLAAKPALASST